MKCDLLDFDGTSGLKYETHCENPTTSTPAADVGGPMTNKKHSKTPHNTCDGWTNNERDANMKGCIYTKAGTVDALRLTSTSLCCQSKSESRKIPCQNVPHPANACIPLRSNQPGNFPLK